MKIVPIKNKLKFLPFHLLFWSLVWLFFKFYFGFNSNNQSYVYWFVSVLMPITIINTYFTVYYLIPKFLISKKYWQFILYSCYCIVGSAYALSIIMFIGYAFMSKGEFKDLPPLSRSLPIILVSIYSVVVLVSAVFLARFNYITLNQKKELENKILQAELQLKEEELKFLKAQIHPHFLFNTLNTIYGLALKKSDHAPESILKLSNLLDYILYQVNKPNVLLKKELEHISNYIDLEKIRFRDILIVNFKTDLYDNQTEIAPMLLMPFIENAFKHGELVNDKLNISIYLKTTKNELDFEIFNSFKKELKNKEGIGLENIRKRLDILYPSKYRLAINKKDGNFIVSLKIKFND